MQSFFRLSVWLLASTWLVTACAAPSAKRALSAL